MKPLEEVVWSTVTNVDDTQLYCSFLRILGDMVEIISECWVWGSNEQEDPQYSQV